MAAKPETAEQVLHDLDTLVRRTRAAGRSRATGFPLIGWGFAWMLGYGALDLATGWALWAALTAAWLAGVLLSWLPLRHEVRTGTERRVQLAWFAVLFASPFLVTAAQPPSFTNIALVLGALWSLAMCLGAIATRDVPYAIVAFIGVIVAGVAAATEPAHPLLIFGLAAGAPLLAVGVVRVIVGNRHG
ncbi:hypothetical protein [Gulosibacter faecalis]|uniref:Uncharacterized protein n=1 Tax=Gulosibacter faecalis TaxID=272240 RepID=A0ABW5UVG1_9MICO|nr:hypothetical protein [Gulosibacter faecalis]